MMVEKMKNIDTSLGCGKKTPASQSLVKEDNYRSHPDRVAENLRVQPAANIFVDSVRRALYQGIVQQVATIAREAARQCEVAIRQLSTQIAADLSSTISFETQDRVLSISIEMPEGMAERIVSETLKGMDRPATEDANK
jgi:hypothetical protein